jgi:polysaccharide export outer membrane protein
LLPALPSGCNLIQTHQKVAEQLAIGPEAPVTREQTAEEAYRVGFPDVLEIAIPRRPDCSGTFSVTPEGCISIAALGNPRIEGETSGAIARKLSEMTGLPSAEVRCQVRQHASSFVYVYGPVNGPERAVSYHGPESVVSLLRRMGGVQPGAKLKDIHVVRGNVISGQPPQVFNVDLEAILLKKDPKTNVVLQPFDSVYLGEMQRSKLGKALPEWLRPVYRKFCTLFPHLCPHDWRQQIREE